MTAGRAPPTNTLPTIRFPSAPTSANNPLRAADTTRLKANVLSFEPTPSYVHSTLIPVRTFEIRLRAINDWFVECSR